MIKEDWKSLVAIGSQNDFFFLFFPKATSSTPLLQCFFFFTFGGGGCYYQWSTQSHSHPCQGHWWMWSAPHLPQCWRDAQHLLVDPWQAAQSKHQRCRGYRVHQTWAQVAFHRCVHSSRQQASYCTHWSCTIYITQIMYKRRRSFCSWEVMVGDG